MYNTPPHAQIFQRMTTYSKYTVAVTFRICFTFGLITVIYDWYFPTILIVVMAVFNDGAMIALAKVRALCACTSVSDAMGVAYEWEFEPLVYTLI